MARRRDSKGRFVSSRRKTTRRRRRRSYRRNPIAANPVRRRRTYRRKRRTYARNVYVANPRRRTYRRQRSYRRNPPVFGRNRILGMSLTEIAYTGVGFIAPPAIEGFVSGYLPTQITSNAIGRWAVKGGIVAGVSIAGGKLISREAGKFLAIGGITYLVANALVAYVPQLFSGFSGYMNPAPAMRRQPLIGKYVSGMGAIEAGVPERSDPRSRF